MRLINPCPNQKEFAPAHACLQGPPPEFFYMPLPFTVGLGLLASALACQNQQCWVNELNTQAPAPLQRFVEVACVAAAGLDPATLYLTATSSGAPTGALVPLAACLPSVWAPPYIILFWVCDSARTALDLAALGGGGAGGGGVPGLAILQQRGAAAAAPAGVLAHLALAPSTLYLAPACVLPAPALAALQAQAEGSLQLVNAVEAVPAALDNTTGV